MTYEQMLALAQRIASALTDAGFDDVDVLGAPKPGEPLDIAFSDLNADPEGNTTGFVVSLDVL